MNIIEALRVAWTALLAHKLRTLLTLLGMIIGVGAVVGMLALGNGYRAYVRSEFNRLGVGAFYLGPTVDSDDPAETLTPRLTAADGAAILEDASVTAVAAVAWEYRDQALIGVEGERYIYSVIGATPNTFEVIDNQLGAGRFFTANEEQHGARVVVIGDQVATDLFGSINKALDQHVTINGVQFTVIGVTTTRPNPMTGALGEYIDPGEQIVVPYRVATTRLFRHTLSERVDVSRMIVQAHDPTRTHEAIEQVTALLRERHRLPPDSPNTFTVTDLERIAQEYGAVTVGISAFLGVIGGISLLVGGIGIMNIMLVSVIQRTREIGLRKAVGARGRDIAAQFLIEAVVLGLVGGALGIALGFGLAQLGNVIFAVVLQAGHIQSIVTPGSLLLATGVSISIGVLFGLLPALRAARLTPIQALR
jgi:putative ABC transport system permease protein